MDWGPALHMIRVDGHLGAMALSAFSGDDATAEGHAHGAHRLAGPGTLSGVLAEMEALGLVLLEVRRMEPQG